MLLTIDVITSSLALGLPTEHLPQELVQLLERRAVTANVAVTFFATLGRSAPAMLADQLAHADCGAPDCPRCGVMSGLALMALAWGLSDARVVAQESARALSLTDVRRQAGIVFGSTWTLCTVGAMAMRIKLDQEARENARVADELTDGYDC